MNIHEITSIDLANLDTLYNSDGDIFYRERLLTPFPAPVTLTTKYQLSEFALEELRARLQEGTIELIHISYAEDCIS